MSALFRVFKRCISTTSACNGKKNFRKFLLYNKLGTREWKERRRTVPDPDIPIHKRGTRDVGVQIGQQYKVIPEKIPELIVPNLKDCKLKPYVSYRTTTVKQSEFTSEDLFLAIYADKIRKDFRENKLNENGDPLEPSEHELLTADEAKNRALKTGCDLFDAEPITAKFDNST